MSGKRPKTGIGHPPFRLDNVNFPGYFPEPHMKWALNFKPRDGDVILTTYPKCGTTWVQSILAHLLNHGDPSFVGSMEQLENCIPFGDFSGPSSIHEAPSIMKTHLWLDDKRWNPNAKYLWVVRNPKDCFTSYLHHCRNLTFYDSDISVERFWELFRSEDIVYGNYFKHFKSYWRVKNEPNVLMICYEDMLENPRKEIMRMAEFLGGKVLENAKNERTLEEVIKLTSFETMKNTLNQDWAKLCNKRSGLETNPEEHGFCRQGKVGDWKNHLSPQLEEEFDTWIGTMPDVQQMLKQTFKYY